jgi:hypothetical protein
LIEAGIDEVMSAKHSEKSSLSRKGTFMKTSRNTILLPKTLKYVGQVKKSVIPEGEGQILNTYEETVLEGIFGNGTPVDNIKVNFTSSQKIEFKLENGFPISGEYERV